MSPLHSIFTKIFVAEFYRKHATLFLLIVGLGFGFMGGYEHMVLASFLTSSPILMAIPIGVWLAYALLVERFNTSTLLADENEFIHMISLYPARDRHRICTIVAIFQLSPVFGYGIFLVLVAIRNHMIIPASMVFMSFALIIAITAMRFHSSLTHIRREMTLGWFTRFINARIAKPFVLFYPEWVARNEPILLAGTKMACLLILYTTAQLYRGETYDLRLMGLALVMVSYGQCNLVWHLHQFDNLHLRLIRNLPTSLAKRMSHLTITFLIVLSPEFGMLISVFPDGLYNGGLSSLLFFGISVPILLYGFLYYRPLLLDRMTTVVFYMSMATFLLILFKVPIWLIGLINLVVGVVLIKWFYYRLQFFETVDQPRGADND
ncbi:MAG: hypothetical protein WKF87_18590 [Chryseolinea sp.]